MHCSNVSETNCEEGRIISKFTFQNGDSYHGEYVFWNDVIMKHGKGEYKTRDCDVYNTIWDKDKYGKTVVIRYNNSTIYNGEISSGGSMNGYGSYTFADGSVINAEWNNNIPVDSINYITGNYGYSLKGLYLNKKKVKFSPENIFWNKVLEETTKL